MGEEICFVSARCNSNPAPKSYGCRLPWGLPQEVSKCKAERKGSHVDHDEADEKFLEAPGARRMRTAWRAAHAGMTMPTSRDPWPMS